MARPVTLFTGQWTDMELEDLARKASDWGYDGLEIACWGGHFEPEKGAESVEYCEERKAILDKYDLDVWAISNHLAGQLVTSPNDDKFTDGFAPEEVAEDAEAKREWGIEQMKLTARAASNLGVDVVPGFTGSPIWHLWYAFPPVPQEDIQAGFDRFAELYIPILDEFEDHGVKFALEVHPTEIAFDIYSFQRALEAVDEHPAFCINFDPSHLGWQGMDPAELIREFPDRIVHSHVKDAAVNDDPRTSLLGSHLPFGDHRRGWEFRSPGRGDIDFEKIIRALNDIGYHGPLSVEWEDSGMDREHGAEEAARFCHELDFAIPETGFEEQLEN